MESKRREGRERKRKKGGERRERYLEFSDTRGYGRNREPQ
jgi:hypothetical protein